MTLFLYNYSATLCPCKDKVKDTGHSKKPSWLKTELQKEPGLHLSPSSVSLG